MENIYKKISYIQFAIIGPKEIKKMSSVKIVTPELYDKEGYPVDGGLMDVRLGVIDPGLKCKVCNEKLKKCIGHFGYVELARPVYHIKFSTYILNILRAICSECNRILIDEGKAAEYLNTINHAKEKNQISKRRKISKVVFNTAKAVKKCPHCNVKRHSFKLEKPLTFFENDKKLTPIDIRTRFEKITNDDVLLLGLEPEFARPEWFILTVMPIPPVTIRPSITLETGERSEDDLTHKLGDIVRINQRLFENINAGAPEVIIEDLWDLLQYHVTTYFDNTITQIPPARHRSGQALKTLTERIKSKEGRFRYNLAGKRINFSARTVISPDPEIEINEVGIPKDVAMDLTIPEMATEWNMKYLKKFVENGPEKYPGSNYVIRTDGKKKKITDETREQLLEELQPGYVVERHIMDGDISIFNRQPSLHRMSLMCHKIRVLPGKSFRLNPISCFPYNADFDGDEMNLHIPQTEEARAEAEILMQVQTQMISPKHGMNVIGCVEDSVTGNYLLSRDMTISKEDAISMLVSIGIEDERIKKFKQKVDGKKLYSVILPENFNFIGKTKDGTEVVITNGEIVSGYLDGTLIGEESGSLIRELHKKYGNDRTLGILSNLFKLGTIILLKKGFTTGISDADLPEELTSKIKGILQETDNEVKELIEKYKAKKLDLLPGRNLEETLELKITYVLNNVRNKIGDLIAKTASSINPTIIMARSGAKGNILNLAMMAACVGQQALKGGRIEKGYTGRTLSSFASGELSAQAKGFIGRGYKEGLDPREFFFGAMTGRDALMDVALRTPKSGYLYRRLANALQDLKIEYDHTVRDANNKMVQFKYGEDGIDVSKSEGGTINVLNIIKEVTKHE